MNQKKNNLLVHLAVLLNTMNANAKQMQQSALAQQLHHVAVNVIHVLVMNQSKNNQVALHAMQTSKKHVNAKQAHPNALVLLVLHAGENVIHALVTNQRMNLVAVLLNSLRMLQKHASALTVAEHVTAHLTTNATAKITLIPGTNN